MSRFLLLFFLPWFHLFFGWKIDHDLHFFRSKWELMSIWGVFPFCITEIKQRKNERMEEKIKVHMQNFVFFFGSTFHFWIQNSFAYDIQSKCSQKHSKQLMLCSIVVWLNKLHIALFGSGVLNANTSIAYTAVSFVFSESKMCAVCCWRHSAWNTGASEIRSVGNWTALISSHWGCAVHLIFRFCRRCCCCCCFCIFIFHADMFVCVKMLWNGSQHMVLATNSERVWEPSNVHFIQSLSASTSTDWSEPRRMMAVHAYIAPYFRTAVHTECTHNTTKFSAWEYRSEANIFRFYCYCCCC